MTFVRRILTLKLQLNGYTFDNGTDTLELTGMRCRATVYSVAGMLSQAMSQMHVQVWGMTPSDMAKISTLGIQDAVYNRTLVELDAYDPSNGTTQIFVGSIHNATVDYNAMPDVSLEIYAATGFGQQLAPIAATSVQGNGDVAAMLQSICNACTPPLTLNNPKNVKVTLSNHAVAGTATMQIADICLAAGINYSLINNTLSIWNYGDMLNDNPIIVSSDKGMVGYPIYCDGGIDVVTEFNPNIGLGQSLQIQTSQPDPSSQQLGNLNAGSSTPLIAAANGTFGVATVTHDLASEMPGGPWFTHAHVSIQAQAIQGSAS